MGRNGVKLNSKTLYKNSKIHLDIENSNPGRVPGSMHIQPYKTDVKYFYNPNDKALYIRKNNEFIKADHSAQKLLDDANIVKAINKGMQYLGEN